MWAVLRKSFQDALTKDGKVNTLIVCLFFSFIIILSSSYAASTIIAYAHTSTPFDHNHSVHAIHLPSLVLLDSMMYMLKVVTSNKFCRIDVVSCHSTDFSTCTSIYSYIYIHT